MDFLPSSGERGGGWHLRNCVPETELLSFGVFYVTFLSPGDWNRSIFGNFELFSQYETEDKVQKPSCLLSTVVGAH